MSASSPAAGATVAVEGLLVRATAGYPIVHDVTLELAPGETLALVGESGSGKTTVALALSGFARPGMEIASGRITLGGQTIDLSEPGAGARLRGRLVSQVPQDPATNLNPSIRIERSLLDVLDDRPRAQSGTQAALDALGGVQLPATRQFLRRYPHQLSGGQQQRVLISMALAGHPPLVVLDEPTTGLDVLTQARVNAEIERLHDSREATMIYVTHDLAAVSHIADSIAVMYGGHVVEYGQVDRVLGSPRHPYTLALMDALPDHSLTRQVTGIPGTAADPRDQLPGCPFAPRCGRRVDACVEELPPEREIDGRTVRCVRAEETPPRRELTAPPPRIDREHEPMLVVDGLTLLHRVRGAAPVGVRNVSFTVARGECVSLVGESGSGKTTIARAIAGLSRPNSGTITLDGVGLAPLARKRKADVRRRCQIIFQNPYESLSPNHRVLDEVAWPARLLLGRGRKEAHAAAAAMLERVRLPRRLFERYPSELSGGERQRVAIARALVVEPNLVICDEVTSALDVSVQAAVLELLSELRREFGLSMLFITHNLAVVANLADRVLVLFDGGICEEGGVEQVFREPQHPHAAELVAAAPLLAVPA